MSQDPEKNARILSRFAFYGQTPEPVRKRMAELARVERMEQGTYYFHEEDSAAHVGLVADGSLRVFKSAQSGREVTLFRVASGEGCALNMLSVLRGQRFPATSLVEKSARVLMLPADDFRGWFESCTSVRGYVLDLIGSRLAALMNLIDEITFERMDRRLAAYLLTELERTGPDRSLQLTQEAIARQLGSAREVVGRLLKELENDGAIALARGSIRVTDAARLRDRNRSRQNETEFN